VDQSLSRIMPTKPTEKVGPNHARRDAGCRRPAAPCCGGKNGEKIITAKSARMLLFSYSQGFQRSSSARSGASSDCRVATAKPRASDCAPMANPFAHWAYASDISMTCPSCAIPGLAMYKAALALPSECSGAAEIRTSSRSVRDALFAQIAQQACALVGMRLSGRMSPGRRSTLDSCRPSGHRRLRSLKLHLSTGGGFLLKEPT
jgi:hypothetical protein